MATISEIAQAAGVSRFSVSCALNGRDDQVNAQTRTKILAVARALGYRPNAAARAARSGRFNAAAFLQRSGSTFFPRAMFEAASRALESHGMHLIATHVLEEDLAQPEHAPSIFRELCVDGMLAHQGRDVPGRVTEAMHQLQMPIVWLNAKETWDAVYPADRENVVRLTQELLGLGHRRITFCRFHPDWGSGGHYSTQDRIDGYTSVMQAAGLAPEVQFHRYIKRPDADIWGGPDDDRLQRARALLSGPNRPTAIIAPDRDSITPVVLAALAVGLRVPQDLTLISIAEEPSSSIGLPVSTAIIPFEAVGRAAVELLRRKIADPAREQPSFAVPFTQTVGATIAPPGQLPSN